MCVYITYPGTVFCKTALGHRAWSQKYKKNTYTQVPGTLYLKKLQWSIHRAPPMSRALKVLYSVSMAYVSQYNTLCDTIRSTTQHTTTTQVQYLRQPWRSFSQWRQTRRGECKISAKNAASTGENPTMLQAILLGPGSDSAARRAYISAAVVSSVAKKN